MMLSVYVVTFFGIIIWGLELRFEYIHCVRVFMFSVSNKYFPRGKVQRWTQEIEDTFDMREGSWQPFESLLAGSWRERRSARVLPHEHFPRMLEMLLKIEWIQNLTRKLHETKHVSKYKGIFEKVCIWNNDFNNVEDSQTSCTFFESLKCPLTCSSQNPGSNISGTVG